MKERLSAVLRIVKRGETVAVTERRRAVAVIVPIGAAQPDLALRDLVRAGRLAWAGGKPSGAYRPPRVRGASVAAAVIEDRR